MTEVWWEDAPTRKRKVKRRCERCNVQAEPLFDIVSPQGTAHYSSEFHEGQTQCGIDATGLEWWWRT